MEKEHILYFNVFRFYVNLIKIYHFLSRKLVCSGIPHQIFVTIRPDESSLTQGLFEYSKKHHLNVIFGGQIPREKVFEMYANSVLLFPSYVESFGLPLLEARLTGSFVIASDCPFSREILNGYDKVSFFSEMDYEEMGRLILKLEGIEI